MAITDKYQQASFRGVPFYIRSESETGGKKVVFHEYPNNDRRFVEELGRNAPVFTMEAFVHGTNAIEDSRRFIKALDTSGVGVLIHPLYGRLEVISTTWNRDTRETELGQINFSVEFAVSESNISLSPDASTLSLVSEAASLARDSSFSAVEALYIVNKAQSVLNKVQTASLFVLNLVSGNIKSLSDIDPEALALFDSVLGTSLKDIYQATVDAAAFAQNLQNFYEAALAITSPSDQRELWEELSDYEAGRIPGPTDTVIRADGENNVEVINGHTRLISLINYFEAVAYTTFNTANELEEARDSLEQKFSDILGGSSNNPLADDNTVRTTMLDLRTITNQVLDAAEENVFRLRTTQPGETSLALLTYDLYGSLDNLETLQNLNENISHSNIKIGDEVEVIA